nr:hypothetical protein BaRGS_017158 [Batillaria attramentaria]
MGVYLAVIGVADHTYRGRYMWNEVTWTSSLGCKAAGFLSLLSSEVSAFTVCLITVDRFVVMRFPLSGVRFGKQTASLACGITWFAAFVLAYVPLLPVTTHWEFYSQSGICIPLPITRQAFKGRDFSFGVMIVLNLALFMMIAVGQAFIYHAIRGNSLTMDTTRKSQDVKVTRRLVTVVVSDFLCWFPIGLLGLLASAGVPVPGELNVAMAVFALPVNSALNPFLYTLNMLLEKRRKRQEARLLQWLESRPDSKRNVSRNLDHQAVISSKVS